MTDAVPPKRIFPTSKVEAQAAKHVPSSPQTESAAYFARVRDLESEGMSTSDAQAVADVEFA